MIRIKPAPSVGFSCECGGSFISSELVWQGLFICNKLTCQRCSSVIYDSLPVNQSHLNHYRLYPEKSIVKDSTGKIIHDNWYSLILKSITDPSVKPVEIEIEVIKKVDKVIILNTLDCVYGHSLLYLLNLQKLTGAEKKYEVIVLVQPMMKWLIPKSSVAEIWTVNLDFNAFRKYYPELTVRINKELERFREVFISSGHIVPTNTNIKITLSTSWQYTFDSIIKIF